MRNVNVSKPSGVAMFGVWSLLVTLCICVWVGIVALFCHYPDVCVRVLLGSGFLAVSYCAWQASRRESRIAWLSMAGICAVFGARVWGVF